MEVNVRDIPALALHAARTSRDVYTLTWIETETPEAERHGGLMCMQVPLQELGAHLPSEIANTVAHSVATGVAFHWFLHKRSSRVDVFKVPKRRLDATDRIQAAVNGACVRARASRAHFAARRLQGLVRGVGERSNRRS